MIYAVCVRKLAQIVGNHAGETKDIIMAKIEFKAKVESVYNHDETVAYQIIRVPHFERRHCDMPAFRSHPTYQGLANSDFFGGILQRIRREKFGVKDYDPHIRLDRLPDGVIVDTSKFLAVVSIDV
jgi:hypothetical protein